MTYFNHYFLVTRNYHGFIHVLIILSSLYWSLVRLLEHDHVIFCPLNSNLLNILLLRLLKVTNYIVFCTLPPVLKAASDATVLTDTVKTSHAIIDNTGYLICCFSTILKYQNLYRLQMKLFPTKISIYICCIILRTSCCIFSTFKHF